MAARSSWKGFLKLSLVSVPVKAFTATPTQSGEIRLNQLHKDCGSRIRYQKTCPIHGEVTQDQIVSGYEHAKDQYVVIDPSEIEKIRKEDPKAVSIQEFVPHDAIDPAYYSGATHYLLPDGPIANHPYAVLYAGMIDQNKYALATMVWHGKEKNVLLRPIEGLIAMSTLSYDQEITKPSAFADQVPKIEVKPEEMQMFKLLIGAASTKAFDYSRYKDTYTEQLSQLIEAKVSGREIVAQPHEPAQIINLMDALKASVAKLQGQAATEPAKQEEMPEKKVAPSKAAGGGRKKKTS